MEIYIRAINRVAGINEMLEDIITEATNDEDLTAAEYEFIYQMAKEAER